MSFSNVRRNRGTTLLEFLIALFIGTLIALAIGVFGSDIFKLSGIVQNTLTAQQDARNILRVLAAELRTASPSNTGAYPLVEVGDNRLRFYSDVTGDGLKEEIIYYLSVDGKTLYKDVRSPSGAPLSYTGAYTTTQVVGDIQNGGTPVFAYYNALYDGSTSALTQPVSPSDVRLIKATIVIERDPGRSPVPITVSTQVMIRNLKDNL